MNMTMTMKRVFVTIVTGLMALALAACTHTQPGAGKWGTGGSMTNPLGKVIPGKGAAASSTAGSSLIGYSRTDNAGVKYCKYRDKQGSVHEAKCDHRSKL